MTSAAPAEKKPRRDVTAQRSHPVTEKDQALGRTADRPSRIPPRGWWAVLRRVWREASSDNLPMVAASCAFYSLLALFPALSVLISLYGLAFDPSAIEGQLAVVRDVLPATTYELIANRVHDLTSTADTRLGWRLIVSLLFALWTATAGTKAMMTALNMTYEEKEKRNFLRFTATAIAFTLAGLFGISLALSIIVGLPAILSFTWLGPLANIALRMVSWGLLLLFLMFGLAMLYRYGPSRAEARWRWITPGSILVAVLWLTASLLFSFYVANFASYDVTYGSLGAVVVAMMWLYISAFVVLLGAELNAELELQTWRDTTDGPERPMGERGAFVADHVAATR
jgi:membrane protein